MTGAYRPDAVTSGRTPSCTMTHSSLRASRVPPPNADAHCLPPRTALTLLKPYSCMNALASLHILRSNDKNDFRDLPCPRIIPAYGRESACPAKADTACSPWFPSAFRVPPRQRQLPIWAGAVLKPSICQPQPPRLYMTLDVVSQSSCLSMDRTHHPCTLSYRCYSAFSNSLGLANIIRPADV